MPKFIFYTNNIANKMAFYKGRRFIKRSFKQRPIYRRKVYKRFVRRNRSEIKYQSMFSATPITTTPTYTLLNGIAQGLDSQERIGRKITMKSFYLRGYIQNADANVNAVRIMAVIDKQPNGAVCNIADILQSSSIVGFRNMDNTKRFSVLMDKFIPLQNTGDSSVKSLRCYKRMFKQVYYDGTSNSISDIQTNSLYFIAFSTDATTGVTLNFSTRIKFIDN